ncbi:hypothetical protein DVB69_13850 [Sporosarcina sp. BI001-red]|nr:hypothetical protein DVB69_13850 [Sporosarcina sp. BI001-red]
MIRRRQARASYILISIIVICTLMSGCNQSSTDWAFSFVVWNGDIYKIDETTTVEKGEQIGVVRKYVENEGNYHGVISNLLPKGSKLYSIKGESTDDAIAVDLDGTIVKADNQGTYKK